VLWSAGGGVAVPDESGGGFVVDGLVWSAGGVVCIEFEVESGAAGAVVEVSEGALGDVDCCFEHATIASALKHNKRRLRFMEITSLYICLCGCLPGGSGPIPAHWRRRWKTTLGRKQRSVAAFSSPGKLEATDGEWAPDMLRVLAVLLGEVA
jgi:hypothetical protein